MNRTRSIERAVSLKGVINALICLAMIGWATAVEARETVAHGPATPDSTMRATALGTGFSYAGRLVINGSPASGVYDLKFELFDGTSSTVALARFLVGDRTVTNGQYTVVINFGADAFNGQARWLQASWRQGSSTGDYTVAGARQQLLPVPNAIYSGSTGALRGRPLSSVAPAAGQVLKWDGTSWKPSADDSRAYAAGAGLSLTGNQFDVDFAGSGSATTAARSDHNHFGETWTGPSGSGLAVSATAGTGLLGTHAGASGTAPGVLGQTSSTDANAAGVLGRVTSTTPGTYSAAVRGVNAGTGLYGIGVWGSQNGAGWGVLGTSISGTGVYGSTTASAGETYGVYGTTSSAGGYGLYGTNTGGGVGVGGTSTTGPGVRGYASSTSGSTYGVYGQSSSTAGTGVYGVNDQASGQTYGVVGTSNSPAGAGVKAQGSGTSGTALELSSGGIKVTGAQTGLQTSTPVFVQTILDVGPSKNTCMNGAAVKVDNPYTNNRPNAILLMTVSSSPGNGFPYDPFKFALTYLTNQVQDCAPNFWYVYDPNRIGSGAGFNLAIQFNIMVINP